MVAASSGVAERSASDMGEDIAPPRSGLSRAPPAFDGPARRVGHAAPLPEATRTLVERRALAFIHMADHRQALEALYKVPLANFVAERDRLAAELRAAGDEEGARQLARRRRPTTSAWTVNQLYWHARDAFDPLLAAAARMRKGDLSETSAYREALGEL